MKYAFGGGRGALKTQSGPKKPESKVLFEPVP